MSRPYRSAKVLSPRQTVNRIERKTMNTEFRQNFRSVASLRCTVTSVLAALLSSITPLCSQIVNDGATVTLSNVTNLFTNNITVGTNGPFTLLVLSDNALVTNRANVAIGVSTTAKSNEVRLVSPSARWLMGGLFAFPTVYLGSNGAFNRVVVSNGATMWGAFNYYIGTQVSSSNNLALVTGPGSLLGATVLTLGNNSAGNQLIVSNGGLVGCFGSTIGSSPGSSNNLAVVTGAGSSWTNENGLNLGLFGAGNQLLVSAGGALLGRSGSVGADVLGSNNVAFITGSGSVWSNDWDLQIGAVSANNRMVISNSATVWGSNAVIGAAVSASNNLVLVTGGGSAWNNLEKFTVGDFSPGNQLIVSNGGSVSAHNDFVIGNTNTAAANSVTLSGPGTRLAVTPGTQLGPVLFIGRFGMNNRLTVQDGALLNTRDAQQGAFSDGNSTLVTGSGTLWTNTHTLTAVSLGSLNRFVITNSAKVHTDTFSMNGHMNDVIVTGSGTELIARSLSPAGSGVTGNQFIVNDGASVRSDDCGINTHLAMVTGAGTSLSNRSLLHMGDGGFENHLVISNGAAVYSGSATIGVSGFQFDNEVLVTGPGSTWSNSSLVKIGAGAERARLIVTNGGAVFSGNTGMIVGEQPSSTNNRVVVNGGTLCATNPSNAAVLDVRRGTNVLNAGLIDADRLIVTNKGTSVVLTAFGNSSSITIPTGSTASQYPSTINVSGLAGLTTKVTVTLSNLSHTFPDDLDILLVSPTGQKVMLMSDAGGGADISNARYTFDDAAGAQLFSEAFNASGTYQPADFEPGESLPSPALPAPYSSSLSAFNGSSPNGAWKLFINDDFNPDSGSLVGWGLQIGTDSSPVPDRGAFEFNGGILLTRGAVISNGMPFVVGTTGSTPASWDVRSGTTNTFVATDLIIGSSASLNALILTNGALLTNSTFAMLGGNVGANSNSATLGGAGSRWWLDDGLFIGDFGSGNRLTVNSGASLVTGSSSAIGNQLVSSNNEALITGAGSSWFSPSGFLFLGGGRGNRLIVSNGASVVTFGGTLGDGFPESSNNVALVTGAGSSWSNTSTLVVGDVGPRNQLIVSNGAAVQVNDVVRVGLSPTSTNNQVIINNGSLRVTNATGTGTLDVRRGSITQTAGLVEVDQLLVTNGLGQFLLNGGTLSSRSSSMGGMSLNVGANIGAATFLLAGNGLHVFGALEIFANSFLIGNGTVGGTVVLDSGGTISPGTSIGKMIFTNTPFLFGTMLMEISKNGGSLTNDQLQVTTTLKYRGILTVTKIGPTALAAGDKFKLFTAPTYLNAFDVMNLPPLPAGLIWQNNLLVDGTIEVATPAALSMSSFIGGASSTGSYTQNFDSLSLSGTGNAWRDNSALQGWYAAQSASPVTITNYRASDGSDNTGSLYSFGSSGSTNRALGSVASDSVGIIAYGFCLTNDTAASVSNFVISYTGERWRNGGSLFVNTLTFWYRVSPAAFTDPEPFLVTNWTSVPDLDFFSPGFSTMAGPLDGNASTNRDALSALIPGLRVRPGQTVFFRWRDDNESGADQGLALDDLVVTFSVLQPRITSVSVNSTNGLLQLAGLGESNNTYAIEAATNLTAPIHWQRLGSNMSDTVGFFQFIDTNAPLLPMRFYRALSP
jgi:T5SS/PEP-CTERM-associated repeat protein